MVRERSKSAELLCKDCVFAPYDGIYVDICLDRSLRLIIQRHFGLFGLVG